MKPPTFSPEIQILDREIMKLIEELGGNSKQYARERRRHVNRIVSEIYSPPRVTAAIKMMPELGMLPGFAMDLTTTDEEGNPYDFDKKDQRDKARRRLEEEKPILLIGSPMCTAFCTWQRINNLHRDPSVVAKEWTKAMVHLNFVFELYETQRKSG